MPDPVSVLVRLVRREIALAGDPDRAPGMQAYMRSSMPYRGVTSVPLRRLLGPLFASHALPDRDAWESCVRELWDTADFREERYAAIELTGHRHYRAHQDPGSLPLYRHLVVSGAWWDLVDPVATRRVGDILSGAPAEVTPVVRSWATDDDLWLRRTAILSQLHRRTETDLDLLRDSLEANLEGSRFGREFFVRKAIGWAPRQLARTDPAWVRGFVAEHHDELSGLSRREALKHLGGEPGRRTVGPGVGHSGPMSTSTAGVAETLRAKQSEIEEQLAVLERKPGDQGSISFGKRVGEGTSMAVDRLSQVAVHDKLQVTLGDVQRAAVKLAAGTYGRCDVCDGPVGDERLEALPWAVLCVGDAGRR